MRKLIAALVVLGLSVFGVLWLREQGGFVVVSVGVWTLQTSVVVFVVGMLLLVLTLYFLIALLRRLLGIPRWFRRWGEQRQQTKARAHLIDGLIRLAEGRFAEAEKLLLKDVERSEAPLLHYLAAAVIAQRQGAAERRDHYIALADKTSPKARLAVGLIQAQLQVEGKQWEQALATLNYLYETSPHHPRLLVMFLKVCQALKEWERLDALLPEMRRQGVLDEVQAAELERTIATHRLEQAGRESVAALERVWSGLSRSQRDDAELVLLHATGLVRQGEADEAERVLRARIPKDWNPRLLQLYGSLQTSGAEKVFAQLEKWLKERPEDPALLYAAGRQALRAKLWGRGRSYLEAAVGRAGKPEMYKSLGELLEQLEEPDAARECYRKALEALPGPGSESTALKPTR